MIYYLLLFNVIIWKHPCLYSVKIRVASVCNYLVPMNLLTYFICHDSESLLFCKAAIWFLLEYILNRRESIFNFDSSTCFVLFTYFFRTKLFYVAQPLKCHFLWKLLLLVNYQSTCAIGDPSFFQISDINQFPTQTSHVVQWNVATYIYATVAE